MLGDHGTELADIRSEQSRLRGVFDSLNLRIDTRTEDRFKKPEFISWKNDHMRYLDARFTDFEHRLLRIERTKDAQ